MCLSISIYLYKASECLNWFRSSLLFLERFVLWFNIGGRMVSCLNTFRISTDDTNIVSAEVCLDSRYSILVLKTERFPCTQPNPLSWWWIFMSLRLITFVCAIAALFVVINFCLTLACLQYSTRFFNDLI